MLRGRGLSSICLYETDSGSIHESKTFWATGAQRRRGRMRGGKRGKAGLGPGLSEAGPWQSKAESKARQEARRGRSRSRAKRGLSMVKRGKKQGEAGRKARQKARRGRSSSRAKPGRSMAKQSRKRVEAGSEARHVQVQGEVRQVNGKVGQKAR